MTKRFFFFRFTIIYALAMIAAGLTLQFFNIENASDLNTPILIGTSYWCLYTYLQNNNRVTDKNEKWPIIWLLLLGDILVSVLLAIPVLITEKISLQLFAIGLTIAVPLHLVILLGVDYFVRKQLLKQSSLTP